MVYGRETAIEIKLSKGLEITGTALQKDGSSASNRFLLLRGVGDELSGVRKSTSCDEQGKFRFAGLEPGKYRIITEFRPQRSDETTLEVDVRENVSDVEVTVPDN